jgi:hypothetical protein
MGLALYTIVSPRFQRGVQPMLDYLRANNFGPKRSGN